MMLRKEKRGEQIQGNNDERVIGNNQISHPFIATQVAPPAELKKQRWTMYLVFCNVAIVIGSSIMFGYNAAVINSPFAIMNVYINDSFRHKGQFLNEQELSVVWSSVVTLDLVGGLIGSVWFPGALASALGRRNALLVGSAIGIAGGLCSFVTPWMSSCLPLMFGRFIAGFATGLGMVNAPGLIAEHAPARLRGALGSLFALGCGIGVSIASFLGLPFIFAKPFMWQYLFLVVAGLFFLHGFCLLFVAESPRYLVAQNNEEGALKALMKLRNGREFEVRAELDEIKRSLPATSSIKTIPFKDFFRSRQLFWPLFLAINLQAVNQLTGIGPALFYATKVMKEAGLDGETAQLANFGISFCGIFGNVLNMFIVDRVGRRSAMLGPLFIVGCSNVMMAVVIGVNSFEASIAAFALFVFVFHVGPGPIAFLMSAEISTTAARPTTLAAAMLTNWTSRIAVGFFFPLLQLKIGCYSFLPFAVISFCEFVFFLLYLPETSARLTGYSAKSHFGPGRSLLQLGKRQVKPEQAAYPDDEL